MIVDVTRWLHASTASHPSKTQCPFPQERDQTWTVDFEEAEAATPRRRHHEAPKPSLDPTARNTSRMNEAMPDANEPDHHWLAPTHLVELNAMSAVPPDLLSARLRALEVQRDPEASTDHDSDEDQADSCDCGPSLASASADDCSYSAPFTMITLVVCCCKEAYDALFLDFMYMAMVERLSYRMSHQDRSFELRGGQFDGSVWLGIHWAGYKTHPVPALFAYPMVRDEYSDEDGAVVAALHKKRPKEGVATGEPIIFDPGDDQCTAQEPPPYYLLRSLAIFRIFLAAANRHRATSGSAS